MGWQSDHPAPRATHCAPLTSRMGCVLLGSSSPPCSARKDWTRSRNLCAERGWCRVPVMPPPTPPTRHIPPPHQHKGWSHFGSSPFLPRMQSTAPMGVLHTPKATWDPCAPRSPLAVLLGGEVQLEVLLHVYHVEEAAPLIALADAARKRTPPSPPISSGAGAQHPGQGRLGHAHLTPRMAAGGNFQQDTAFCRKEEKGWVGDGLQDPPSRTPNPALPPPWGTRG